MKLDSRLTESSAVRLPDVASEDVADKMLETISRLSEDWSTVLLAALTIELSSFTIIAAFLAVMDSYM